MLFRSQEMEALTIENTRSKNPAMHFILSWREMEVPTSQQVDEAVQIALHELDLQGCQALWALQNDTKNLHVHVMVNWTLVKREDRGSDGVVTLRRSCF